MRIRKAIFLLFVAICLFPIAALASSGAYQGFFIGFQPGVASAEFRYDLTANELTGTGITKTFDLGDQLGSVSPVGRILIVYGWQFQHFYLGLDLAGSLFRFDASNVAENQHVEPLIVAKVVRAKMILKNATSVGLRPGFLINPKSMVFLKVGAAFSRAELEGQTERLPTGVQSLLINSHQKTLTAFEVGIGFEHFILSYLTFSMQYLFDDYGRISASDITENRRLTNALGFDVRMNSFLLGLAYYFDHGVAGMLWTPAGTGFNGLSLGLFAGVMPHLQNSHETDDYIDTREYSRRFINNASNINLNAGLTVTLSHVLHWLYLGAVVTGQWGNSTARTTSMFTNSHNGGLYDSILKTKIQNAFSVDITPGIAIDKNHVLFAIVGATLGRVRAISSFNASSNADTEINGVTSSKHEDGLRLGLGFQMKITHNMAIGIQDVFTFYPAIQIQDVGVSVNNNRIIHAVSFVPRTNSLTLHYSYFLSA